MKLNTGFHFNVNNTALEYNIQTAPTPMRRAISAFADYGATVTGTVKATSNTHGLATGDIITISGTTNYNGTFVITKIDANDFYFTDTWVANDGASILQKVDYLTFTRADVKVILYTDLKLYYRFSLTIPNVTDGQLVATTDLFIADTTEKELYIPWGMTSHKDDSIYLLLLAAATGGPTISAVVQ